MKTIFAALILLVFVLPASANEASDKQLRDLCVNSDAVVHIRVEATADVVDKISLIRILKQSGSFSGKAGVNYALTIKRPGEKITRSDWYIQHPGDYVIFCNFPVGDINTFSEPSIAAWSLYKDNDFEIKQTCDSINTVEQDAAANP